MDPPPDPPEGDSDNNNHDPPSSLTVETTNNNNNNNNTSQSNAAVPILSCVYEARRPVRLQQYDDGMSNNGFFFVEDESSPRAQHLAAFLRHYGYTITVHRHIPSVEEFLVDHPGTVVTAGADIPEYVFDQGLQHLMLAQSPHSTGNTAFFSPTSGVSSSPGVQASPSSQGFSFGDWSSSTSQGRASSSMPPSSMFGNTSQAEEAVPPAATSSVPSMVGTNTSSSVSVSEDSALNTQPLSTSTSESRIEQLLTLLLQGQSKDKNKVEIKLALSSFNGKKEDWIGFYGQLLAVMENDDYSPRGELVTNDENREASKRMRQLLLNYCRKDAAALWTNRPEFEGKGFEMVASMIRKYAPNNKEAVFTWYNTLFTAKQQPNESITLFTARLREANANLRVGGVNLDPMILTLIFMHGLGDDFMHLKKDMALNAVKYVDKSLDDVEHLVEDYIRVSSKMDPLGEDAGPSAASAAASANRVDNNKSPPVEKAVYPPPDPPPIAAITEAMSGRKCGLCHRTGHPEEDCVSGMEAGLVITRDPEAAKAKLKKLKDSLKKKTRGSKTSEKGEHSADVSSATALSSSTTHTSSPPPTQSKLSATKEEEDELEFDSMSDSDGSFFEHDDSVQDDNVWKMQGRKGSTPKPKSAVSPYSPSASCSSASFHTTRFHKDALRILIQQHGCKVTTKINASVAAKIARASSNVAIADTGATHHLWPDYKAFISYRRLSGEFVRLADKSLVRIMGIGSIAIMLGGKRIIIRDVYHVPSLRAPLFSLRTHRRLKDCGFMGDNNGFTVWFPTFTLDVNDDEDSLLSYSPIGNTTRKVDYIQPRTSASSSSTSKASPRRSARIQERKEVDTPVVSDDESLTDDTASGTDDDSCNSTPSGSGNGSSEVIAIDSSGSVDASNDNTLRMSGDSMSLEKIFEAYKVSDGQDTSSSSKKRPHQRVRFAIPTPKSSTKPFAVPSPLTTTKPRRIDDDELLLFSSDPTAPAPPIRSCDTPNGSDTLQHFTSDAIYKLFGNRRFRNYEHFCLASKDSKFINGGEPTPSLGEYTTMRKRKRGKVLPPTPHYLAKVHMDIVYGDTISRLGYRYALLLCDRATKYLWIYGLKSLTSTNIIECLEQFRLDAGRMPTEFRCDCDMKFLGGDTRRWIRRNQSRIHGAAAGRQSSNGLVERMWQTICSMARAYLVEKQMPRDYWFFAVQHAARMMNMIPGKVNGRLTTPFELVHRCPPDSRTWFPIFSMVYFYHESDSDKDRVTMQSNAMQGIAVGRSNNTNALLVYHPVTKKYYEPDTYKFDPSRLPSNEWPSRIKYDGGLFVDLYRDGNTNVPEPYPPGLPLKIALEDDSIVTAIVSSIPIRAANGDVIPDEYQLTCPDGSMVRKTLEEMDIIADTPANRSAKQSSPSLPEVESLPVWLQHGRKVTYRKDNEYHKGFIIMKGDGTPRFSCRRQLSARQESWGVDLPNLLTDWPLLTQDNTLIPSWNYLSVLRPLSNLLSSPPLISANHVSARDLKEACPSSLLQALNDSHPDRDTWKESYYEEKHALVDNATYVKIRLEEYRRLRRKGAPKAIPSMCVLTIKPDENLNPLRAKSRIVVLGNLEDRPWLKSDKFAPVLQYSSLRLLTSMAVEKRRRLKQGDCKNAFCQGTLPDNEMTIIKPPPGDPDADKDEFWLLKKTLYGLCRSPRHWYDLITSTLTSIGFTPSVHDPCLWVGKPSSDEETAQKDDAPLYIGLYVDDFVYFSEDDDVERRFERILGKKIKCDFMGTVNWFLGTHFEWADHANGALSVHLSQAAYAQNIVERLKLQDSNFNPNATPYRSGCPIDSIPSATIDENDPYFVRRRESYQSLVGSLTWLATNTRPDLAPATSFLSSYNSCPSSQHWEAAKYVARYLRSTTTHGIAYHSSAPNETSAYIHFPFPHDSEAYNDSVKPPKDRMHELSTYTDACWGSQLGNIIPDGDEIEMWKFRSMSGFLVMRCGGPIAWKAVRQEQCSRSTCEAEIRATDEGIKEVLSLRHRCDDMGLPDSQQSTPVYNDNQGCVDWAKTTSTKGMRHINLKDCAVRDSIQSKDVTIHHIQGDINPADIFTKEMKDGQHFRTLRDSFMLSSEKFRTFVSDSDGWISASWVTGISLGIYTTVLQQVREEVDDECTSLSIESTSINSDSKHKRRRHHRCYYCPNYINNTIIAKCKGSIYLAFISHVCFITASLFYLKLAFVELSWFHYTSDNDIPNNLLGEDDDEIWSNYIAKNKNSSIEDTRDSYYIESKQYYALGAIFFVFVGILDWARYCDILNAFMIFAGIAGVISGVSTTTFHERLWDLISVHLYLGEGYNLLKRDHEYDMKNGYGILFRCGDFFFLFGSILDVVGSYLDLAGIVSIKVAYTDLVSCFLWVASSLLDMSAEIYFLRKKIHSSTTECGHHIDLDDVECY